MNFRSVPPSLRPSPVSPSVGPSPPFPSFLPCCSTTNVNYWKTAWPLLNSLKKCWKTLQLEGITGYRLVLHIGESYQTIPRVHVRLVVCVRCVCARADCVCVCVCACACVYRRSDKVRLIFGIAWKTVRVYMESGKWSDYSLIYIHTRGMMDRNPWSAGRACIGHRRTRVHIARVGDKRWMVEWMHKINGWLNKL